MLGDGGNFLLGQENWESKISLKLTLARNEITTIDHPPPLYIQVPRMGYLPILAEQALIYFRHVLPPGEETPWFEVNSLPLRWHVPLGVLYDLLTDGTEKPWHLVVHYRAFPASALPPYEGLASLRAAYINSLKEAAYICAGSSAAVMGMASVAQDELWKSVEDSNFGQYFRMSESMNIAARREGRKQSVPLRLYIKSGSVGRQKILVAGVPNNYNRVQHTSRPVAANREDGSQANLADTLNHLLPEYFEPRPSDNSNIGETASVSADPSLKSGEAGPQAAASGREEEGQQWLLVGKSGGPKSLLVEGKQVDVWISGIRPRLDTPLAWLHSQLRHPDHFLYVVLHVY